MVLVQDAADASPERVLPIVLEISMHICMDIDIQDHAGEATETCMPIPV